MEIDITPFLSTGIPGILLLWFMLRLERILNRFDKTVQLITRAIIRLLEREDPEMASGLSKALSHANGEEEPLPGFRLEVCKPQERMQFRTVAGGGYGNPTKRDPHRVARDANRQWLSVERAEKVYKVALKLADNGIDYLVDEARTATLRSA